MSLGDENRQGTRYTGLLVFLAFLPAMVKVLTLALGTTGYLAQLAYKIFQVLTPLIWRRKIRRTSLLNMFWPFDEPLPSVSTWLLAVGVAGLLAGSAIMTVCMLSGPLGLDSELLREQFDKKFNMTPLLAVFVVFYLFSLNAALEELHFRAWLDYELSARWGNFRGIAASSLAFAGMHLFIFTGMNGVTPLMLMLVFIALAIAGISWSLIARRPGGIHAAWLSHGLTDAGLLTWGLFWLGYFSFPS